VDFRARLLVEDLVEEGRARGRTVLLASHERPREGLVDRTVRMDAGRLREEVRT
jgi:ABC-type transport system involved in cytochrome bd biosynthesis fused ATPase/permease subunit